jgi:hypothetical protein
MGKESGVKVEGFLYFSTTVYGEIEKALRNGDKDMATQMAFELVVDALNCEDTSNIQVNSVEVYLNT